MDHVAVIEECDGIRSDCNDRFRTLFEWQERQNGSLQTIQKLLWRAAWLLIGALCTTLTALVLLAVNLACRVV